ncbi:MAG TPA: xanthine dehydrogenase family protein subunit M [Symbiobacteriaceae bacterium]|nr:xanthine dehydrogenase family protein subunit M [Symbiobacteriaceae bacterium]
MKPPRFAYHDPTTIEEVLDLLHLHGDEAKLLAGGQSLIPVLNMRLTSPKVLIDLGRIPMLAFIREEAGFLALGAMTRHALVERSALVAQRQPLLAEAIRQVGHPQIRNRGTIGGSLAHADPAAELPAVLLALGGSVVVQGRGAQREIAAADLFQGLFTTAIGPTELLTEVRVPVLPERTGWAFVELARRHGDFALAGVACTLTLAPDGQIAGCQLALTGVGAGPVQGSAAASSLVGKMPSATSFAEAAALVQAAVEPESDIHATAAYRRHLAGLLTERALAQALARVSRLEGGAAG